MYGVIFHFLRDYVIERHGGEATWKALLDAQGYKFKLYFPVQDYPDEEIIALVETASKALDTPIPVVLEDFGSYVGPQLLSFYHMYIKNKEMTTFDVIEAAGGSIHDVIHKHNPNRKPPRLSSIRESDDVLMVHYQSHRKLCPVVRGIIRGLGEKFNERFDINETQCMHDGADKCIMKVTRLDA
ncbi:MAG: heme NO-binding domain-containing protein [Candidatus Thiodiazotropha sp.]|nr:heme NO-binding domain-containing protein [Candidatus Thiodiazotropha sp.]MCM8885368.1 heme NO-binding domain-containing protein [Candidatus Thiodiazotropha sp.]MCM8921611.1 heme NO-binding domain-containing protein [Candidatus Thiodiazotropha sp.]MCU7873867.1 heme NO-binding domain-containing protein [Candidatus Thiodiazotropha sp. (ex Lucinoma borealis)]